MGSITEEFSSPKLIASTGIFSFTFVTLLLLTLHYSGQLNNVGKYNSYYVIIVLIAGELTKYFYKRHLKNPQKSSRYKPGNLARSLLLLFATITIFYTIPVLYGAAVFAEFEATLMLALTITTLTTFQSLINLGYRNTMVVLNNLGELSLSLSDAQIVRKQIQGCLIGALCGAVVIPLDWNRAWQVWPIPCFVGALFGHGIANVFCATLTVFPKKRSSNRKRCV